MGKNIKIRHERSSNHGNITESYISVEFEG